MSENLSRARLRVGDLLVTSVGTWVIVGDCEADPSAFSWAWGFLWIAFHGNWVFREMGVQARVMRADRVIS